MAGTNKKKSFLHSKPAIILKNPQLPENIGMVARSMVNYGFSDLRIVKPRITWPSKKAIAASAGAFDLILKKTRIFKKLDIAFSNIDILFATSVRTRELDTMVLSPRDAVYKICNEYNNLNIGFLFGAEKAGLNNNDLSEANYIIQIPTNPIFGSLNLAMAVNIICYEWYTYINIKNTDTYLKNNLKIADKRKVSHFKEFLIKTLHEIGFFKNKDQDAKLEVNLKNIFSKSIYTDKELLMFYGIIKSLKKYKNK